MVSKNPKLLAAALALSALSILSCVGGSNGGGNGSSIKVAPGEIKQNEPKIANLIFGGDLMVHLTQIASADEDKTSHFNDCFRHIAPLFRRADIAIINLETTLTDDGKYSGYPMFASPSEVADAVKNAGIDIVMLANNHICDKGRAGIEKTARILDQRGIKYTGAFPDSVEYRRLHPLKVESNGINFAIFNYTYGTNGMPIPKGMIVNLIDTIKMGEDLRLVDRSKTDHIIMFFHWGNEYERQPNRGQMAVAQWCHSRGVEIVIGSHPHVIQPILINQGASGEILNITAYSLGNIVSNQRWRYSDGGILCHVGVTKSDSTTSFTADYTPFWVYKKMVGNRSDYYIMPIEVADTMIGTGDFQARKEFEIFKNDSAKGVLDTIV